MIVTAAVLLLGSGILSCGDTIIDPFNNDNRYFTVYGFLDELETDHVIRLIPITRRNQQIVDPSQGEAKIDASVTSTNLETGVVRKWTHTLKQFSDGTYGHIYRATFRVRPGDTYRLEIVRNDGKMTTAETRIPFISSTQVTRSPIVVEANSSIGQDFILPGIMSPWQIQVKYWAGGHPTAIHYGRTGYATEDGDWVFRVNYTRDRERLAAIKGLLPEMVSWTATGVSIRILDNNWDPPDDIFDPDILAQPGTLSNVENGWGFWGSVGLFQDEWVISPELKNALGF